MLTQNLILILCVLIWSFLCGGIGFYYAKSPKNAKPRQTPPEPSEEDIRRLKKSVQEYQNFLSYDGTKQE